MKTWLCGLLVMLVVCGLVAPGHCAPPSLLTYQGALTDAAGKPAGGTFNMTFAMYSAKTGGVAVWTEVIANVQVTNGVFTVLLGGTVPLPAGLVNCTYLEVAVNGTAMKPRQRLTSVPYALEAANARTLDGRTSGFYRNAGNLNAGTLGTARLPMIQSGKLAANAVTAAKIATGAVTTAKIAAGAVTSAQLAPDAVTGAKVQDGSLTGADLADDSVGSGKIDRTGLDADLLDGKEAADFADVTHSHDLSTLTGQVGTSQIVADAVTGAKVQDGSLAGADLADGSVGAGKIDRSGLDADLLDGKEAADFADATHSHDLGTLTGQVGGTQIADGAISGPKIAIGTNVAGTRNGDAVFAATNAGTAAQSKALVGNSTGVTGDTVAVLGQNQSVDGIGVWGEATAPTGAPAGVRGRSSSPDGFGVVGSNLATTGQARGVFGETNSTSDGAMAVQGQANGATGVTYGVHGQTNSTAATASGVQGIAAALSGATHGVHGTTYSIDSGACGVYGLAAGVTGNTSGVYGQTNSTTSLASAVYGHATATSGTVSGVRGETASTSYGAAAVHGSAYGTSGETHGVSGYVASPNGHALHAYCTSPDAYGLYVAHGKAYFAGYATFAGGHGDLAENYRGRNLEAGDVAVIGPGGVLVKCAKEMDTTVAGIVSTQPSMKLSGRLDDSEGVVPLALVGRVLCKVDATRYPIKAGDLLTTSETPGHAMKALSARRAASAVIGKALEGLDKGTGVIQVLVTLR